MYDMSVRHHRGDAGISQGRSLRLTHALVKTKQRLGVRRHVGRHLRERAMRHLAKLRNIESRPRYEPVLQNERISQSLMRCLLHI